MANELSQQKALNRLLSVLGINLFSAVGAGLNVHVLALAPSA